MLEDYYLSDSGNSTVVVRLNAPAFQRRLTRWLEIPLLSRGRYSPEKNTLRYQSAHSNCEPILAEDIVGHI